MKLRIKDNTLRLRVSRSDLERLLASGRIDATIHFAPAQEAKWTYALEHRFEAVAASLEYKTTEIIIVLPSAQTQAWAESEQVGIYETYALGQNEFLNLLVEKDFACLDLSDADNDDTFPNPAMGRAC
jgi:hypothetical protein